MYASSVLKSANKEAVDLSRFRHTYGCLTYYSLWNIVLSGLVQFLFLESESVSRPYENTSAYYE